MRASRLVSLLLLLQTRGLVTMRELAERFGLSMRTVHRDLEALAASGVPIETVRGPAGGVRLAGGYRTRLTGLTREEAETLFLSGVPGPVGELGLGSALATAQLKLLAALPGELREHASMAGELFHIDAPGWFRGEERTPYLATIADALWERQRLDTRYRLRDKTVRRVLDPLGLVLKAGVWYLIARPAKGSIRVYRVSRFASVRARDEQFERPPDFDLGEFWAQRIKEFERSRPEIGVRLRATRAGATQLGWLVPDEKQRIDELLASASDDWLELTVPFEDLEHAYGDLIRLGAEAEVFSPPELRARLTRTARTMAGFYEGRRRRVGRQRASSSS